MWLIINYTNARIIVFSAVNIARVHSLLNVDSVPGGCWPSKQASWCSPPVGCYHPHPPLLFIYYCCLVQKLIVILLSHRRCKLSWPEQYSKDAYKGLFVMVAVMVNTTTYFGIQFCVELVRDAVTRPLRLHKSETNVHCEAMYNSVTCRLMKSARHFHVPSSLASVISRMVYISGASLPRLSWKKGR